MLALLELGLVLGLGLAWGLYELGTLRRERSAREKTRTRTDTSPPAP